MLSSKSNGYSSSFHAFWSTSKIKYVDKHTEQCEHDFIFQGPGPGCTFVLDRNLFSSLQKFIITNYDKLNIIYYHDWFIYCFARTRFYKWFIDSNSYIYYRQHSSNDTGVNTNLKSFLKRFKLINNSFALEQVHYLSNILGYDNKLTNFFRYPISIFLILPNIIKYRRDLLGRVALSVCVITNYFKKF